MAKRELFLVIDIGSTAVHIGEFESTQAGALYLHAFDNIEYPETLTEDNRRDVITGVVRRAISTGKYRSRNANVCVSGQSAFMRFVKLPPVTDDEQSVRQIVAFEAKQNVPFPIDEVVWDYQLIGSEENEDELEVMFAVIKTDVVEAVTAALKDAGIRPRLVDFSPAALYNAARANYVGENECAMLLDIGGKCTSLLFLEGSRLFARSIPIAGGSITQQIGKEFNISFEEAEILKRRYGFVALGGAYEEPESEVAATISKIIRNVMTRLHGEINRTINIYRSQQKGSKPIKLFLAGGSSTMAFTEHFFSEKLRMEVSYFNAFNIVRFGPSVDREQLSQLAHLFPGLVGCALRNVHHCPVEISLSNEDGGGGATRRLPAIAATCFVILLSLGLCYGINLFRLSLLSDAVTKQQALIKAKSDLMSNIKTQQARATEAKDEYDKARSVLNVRTQWARLLNAIQAAKPLDTWVKTLEKTGPGDDESEASRSNRPANEVPAFFLDAGMPAGGGGNRGADREEKKDEAKWFVLEGYTARIVEEANRPIFHQEQVYKFNEILKQRKADNPNLGDDMPTLPFLGKDNSNVVSTQTILPNVFEGSLRFSDYFHPVNTRLERLNAGVYPTARNVSYFKIRLELVEPITLKR